MPSDKLLRWFSTCERVHFYFMLNQLSVLKQVELCGQQFCVYGTTDEPLFKAKDVALWINHSDVSKMVQRVDEEEKVTNNVRTPGGNQDVWFLTENGLYEVLMQSRKPIAKQFKKGVKQILKEIRTKGGYMVAHQEETPEQIMARALKIADDTIKRVQQQNTLLTQQIEQNKPKVLFADAVTASEDSILIGELATILNQKGVKFGQNRLFTYLRENGYLCKEGERRNQPTQKALDLGLFQVKKSTINAPNGSIIVSSTTKVTGKGQIYFINKLIPVCYEC